MRVCVCVYIRVWGIHVLFLEDIYIYLEYLAVFLPCVLYYVEYNCNN